MSLYVRNAVFYEFLSLFRERRGDTFHNAYCRVMLFKRICIPSIVLVHWTYFFVHFVDGYCTGVVFTLSSA